MDKDTEDIEIKLLSSEEILMIGEEQPLDIVLDESIIEELYQEQVAEAEVAEPAENIPVSEDTGFVFVGDTGMLPKKTANAEEANDIEEDEEENLEISESKVKKGGVAKKIMKSILLTLEILILALIAYVVVILVQSDSKKDFVARLSQSFLGKTVISMIGENAYNQGVKENIDKDEIIINDDLEHDSVLEGEYTTFVIFGVDARGDEFDSGTNADTMIIVSINNETGSVRMASVYRDTYLQIPTKNGDVRYGKANSAYATGGALNAINMLNTNFDLAIEDYVVVNFSGVADIIDALGGLDINLTKGEVNQINYHLKSTMESTGEISDKVQNAGLNHLNGMQALTYARIRKVKFTHPVTGEESKDDFGRAARQQYVISLIADKAKKAGVSEVTDIAKRIFDGNAQQKVIGTTFEFEKIIDMIPLAMDFNIDGNAGYPLEKTTSRMSDLSGADCVIPTNLVEDVSALHAFLYDKENYTPTAAVHNISDTIQDRLAIYGY